MNFLPKQINRKIFIGISLILAVCLAVAKRMINSPNSNEITIGTIVLVVLIIVYLVSIHLRCNDIEGRNNLKLSITIMALSFIPVVSFFVFLYLAVTKGINTKEEFKEISNFSPTTTSFISNVIYLQNKYKSDLLINDENKNKQIVNDLYISCNHIPPIKEIIIKNSISQNDFMKYYSVMKSDSVLWDDKTGTYLPFVSMLTPKTLKLLIDNSHLPKSRQKEIVLRALNGGNERNLTINSGKWNVFFRDLKKTWLLVFLAISMTMMLYPPYHTIVPGKGEEFVGYNIIGEIPSNVSGSKKKFTTIDYATLAFHEVILVIVCCGGYTLSTMMKKR